jgi:hypothetical protein
MNVYEPYMAGGPATLEHENEREMRENKCAGAGEPFYVVEAKAPIMNLVRLA